MRLDKKRSLVSREDFEAFCGGFACNESVEILKIECRGLLDAEMFSLLGPFFNENSNLRRLTISGSDGFSGGLRKCSSSLLDALTKFNSLREFECHGHRIYDIYMAPIIRALEGHSGF